MVNDKQCLFERYLVNIFKDNLEQKQVTYVCR